MKAAQPIRPESPRKTYGPPRLTRYGKFREIVQGGGGTRNEPGAGNPNSRV
jgi:hypothetical protein